MHCFKDTVSERLRRWTRNPLGSARRGSNPLGVVSWHKQKELLAFYGCFLESLCISLKPRHRCFDMSFAHFSSVQVLDGFPEPCHRVAIAQLAARRSHNPKVVSSILTRHICWNTGLCFGSLEDTKRKTAKAWRFLTPTVCFADSTSKCLGASRL